MARNVALSAVRSQVRAAADMTGSTFRTDAEINTMINASLAELYDHVTESYDDQYASSASFTVVSGTATYSLATVAATFYKLIGLERLVSGTTYETLRRFTWSERNSRPTSSATGERYQYRVMGGNIHLIPVPANSTDSIRLWYVPTLTALSADGDTFDGINYWEEFVVADVASKLLAMEESDPSYWVARRKEQLARILSSAPKRDVSEPDRISDVSVMGTSDLEWYPWR